MWTGELFAINRQQASMYDYVLSFGFTLHPVVLLENELVIILDEPFHGRIKTLSRHGVSWLNADVLRHVNTRD